jgi:hypothetical protein
VTVHSIGTLVSRHRKLIVRHDADQLRREILEAFALHVEGGLYRARGGGIEPVFRAGHEPEVLQRTSSCFHRLVRGAVEILRTADGIARRLRILDLVLQHGGLAALLVLHPHLRPALALVGGDVEHIVARQSPVDAGRVQRHAQPVLRQAECSWQKGT